MVGTVGTLIAIHAFRLVVYLVETTGHLVHQVQVHYGRRLINERGDEQLVVPGLLVVGENANDDTRSAVLGERPRQSRERPHSIQSSPTPCPATSCSGQKVKRVHRNQAPERTTKRRASEEVDTTDMAIEFDDDDCRPDGETNEGGIDCAAPRWRSTLRGAGGGTG